MRYGRDTEGGPAIYKVEEIENEWREASKQSRKGKRREILKENMEAGVWGGEETERRKK